MATVRDKYDEEMVAVMTGAKATEDTDKEPEAPHPFDSIEAPAFAYNDEEVPFSELFWKPVAIPDIPVRVYTRDYWDEAVQHMIPDVDPDWYWNRRITEAFALAMYCGDTTLLWGLAGTGKTQLAVQWGAQFNIPVFRQSCHRETRESHFLGAPSIEYDEDGKPYIKQEPTALTESLRYGGIFIEDEAFRHNAGLVLQSLREKSNRTVVLPDAPGLTGEARVLKAPVPDWWYVMTDNTTGGGDTTGMFDAEVQDASTLDRIDSAIEVPYLTPSQETRVLSKKVSLDKKTVLYPMTQFAQKVRAEFGKGNLLNTMSLRPLMAWAEKAELTGSLEQGLRMAWYSKLPEEDKAQVLDMYSQHMDGRNLNK